jgi:hypothetical protein
MNIIFTILSEPAVLVIALWFLCGMIFRYLAGDFVSLRPFLGFLAEGRIRVSPQMARGMHRSRFADIGMREGPKERKRREDEGARFLENWKAYPGDSRGIGG